MQLKHLTIRKKLVTLVTVLLVCNLLTTAIGVYFSYQDMLYKHEDRLAFLTQSTLQQLPTAQTDITLDRLSQTLQNIHHDSLTHIALLDHQNQIVASANTPEAVGLALNTTPMSDAQSAHIMTWPSLKKGDDQHQKLTLITPIQNTAWQLAIGISVNPLSGDFFSRSLAFLVIFGFIILLTALTLTVLQRHLLEPLQHLTISCKALLKGDTDYPITPRNSHDEIGRMTGAIAKFKDYLDENKRLHHLQERVQFLESFDPVTHLYNRHAIGEAVEQALLCARENGARESCAQEDHAREDNNTLHFLFIRFDQFRNLTIQLGVEQRDQILIETSQRISQLFSFDHRLARVSEGSFGLLLLHHPSYEEVKALCRHILQTIEKPIMVNGVNIQVSARIGITQAPSDGTMQFEIIGRAEIAAKTALKEEQEWLFFNQIKEKQTEDAIEIWQDLSVAMDQDQFHLVFQPLFDLDANAPLSAETLLRWIHPEKGFISPAVFIPLAEQSGLISRLDNWVLNAVAKQCRSWLDRKLNFPKVAVNLSGITFMRPDFLDTLQSIFNNYHVPLSYIELELTEGVLIDDLSRIQEKLNQVRDTGVSISIDDFGTGYSSLSRLKDLPVDKLKIDRSFIEDIEHNHEVLKIVQAIILMAQGLNLKVVAEGVENEDQLSILRKEQCNIVQGYLLSRPLNVADYEALIDEDLVIEGD